MRTQVNSSYLKTTCFTLLTHNSYSIDCIFKKKREKKLLCIESMWSIHSASCSASFLCLLKNTTSLLYNWGFWKHLTHNATCAFRVKLTVETSFYIFSDPRYFFKRNIFSVMLVRFLHSLKQMQDSVVYSISSELINPSRLQRQIQFTSVLRLGYVCFLCGDLFSRVYSSYTSFSHIYRLQYNYHPCVLADFFIVMQSS